jgi:hypothetical protein
MKTALIQLIRGVEGNCLSVSFDKGETGQRLCGPKPRGGGKVIDQWAVNVEKIVQYLKGNKNE